MRSRLGYPLTLMVEISAELKQDAQRSRAWQHHSRMMKDRKGMPPPQDMRLYGSIQLPRGGWLQFSSLVDKESASWSWQTTLNLMLVASLVIGLMIWLFRRATLPLKQLAANADRLGSGEDIEPLREEVRPRCANPSRRSTACTPGSIVSCRTAPGCWRPSPRPAHPITSLRLRAEFLDEGRTRSGSSRPCSRWSRCWRRPSALPGRRGSRRRPGSWIW